MVAKLPRPDIASSFSRCRAFQAVCSTRQWKLYKPRVHRRGTRTQATPNLCKRRGTATWTPGQATPLANVRWSDLAMADSELPTCRENAAALNWTVSHSFRVWLLARYGSGHYDQRTSWFAWNVTFCWYRSLLQFPPATVATEEGASSYTWSSEYRLFVRPSLTPAGRLWRALLIYSSSYIYFQSGARSCYHKDTPAATRRFNNFMEG